MVSIEIHPIMEFAQNIPSSHVTVLFGGFDVAIQSSGFLDATSLGLNASCGVDIRGMSMAIIVWRLVHVVLFLLHDSALVEKGGEVEVRRGGREKRVPRGTRAIFIATLHDTKLH